jgi:hypothetical protein
MVTKPANTRATSTQLLSERTQESVLALILVGLLLGFVVVVLREIVATLGGSGGYESDEYQLFAVSLTGLTGGVFAVAMNRDQAAPRSRPVAEQRIRRTMGTAFVVAYVLAGVVAIGVCLVRLGDSTSLLRSLAATFLGTSVAAASALFGTAQNSSDTTSRKL